MRESFIFGLIPYTPKQIWGYLKKDIEDDWFQDPILYEDYRLSGSEPEYFDQNIRKNFGRYLGSEREELHVPKGNFTLRHSLETTFYDRFMYFCLTIPLIQEFDELISPRVFSHRYSGGEKQLFRAPINQWSKFEGIVRAEAPSKTILETDIQNYFENIQLSDLKTDLERCLLKKDLETEKIVLGRFIIDRLIENLEKWAYDRKRGLPQNRDCSSFLANIYMISIDQKMIDLGFEYYRYMDDIRIVCSDKFEARNALKILVHELRSKHLSLNGKKTRIIDPGSSDHNLILTPDLDLKQIDSLLSTKKKANVSLGYELLKEKLISLMKNGEFESRSFRFCINRMAKLARCKDYNLPADFWDEITLGIKDAIIECPPSTDRIYEYLASIKINDATRHSIESFLNLSDRSIYEWQNYWLWKLLVLWGLPNEKCLELARRVRVSDSGSGDKAGAILYLAKFGTTADILNIKNSISKDESSFLQRHKILACRELDWKREMQEHKEDISDQFKMSYRILAKKIKEIVFQPPETDISTILNSVHQYD